MSKFLYQGSNQQKHDNIKQEAFEKCWAHSPLRAAARRLFYIAIHQVSLLSHAACASMSTTTTTTTTTTTRDRGDRYGPIEWAKQSDHPMKTPEFTKEVPIFLK